MGTAQTVVGRGIGGSHRRIASSDRDREVWTVFYRPGAQPHSALRVLMIEDDRDIADMYRFQLEADGFAVTTAQTGEAALAALTATAPDIILLDILLPGKSGFELLEDLKQNGGNDLSVVFLSNFGDPEFIERGLALGAVDYLVNSRTTPSELSRRIRGWIEASGGRLS